MELIDKRKLIEKVKTFHKWCIHTDNFPMIPSKRNNVGYLADDVLFGIDLEPTVKAVPIEVVEQIRAEITAEVLSHSGTGEEVIQAYVDGLNQSLRLIDKAIKEVEQ